MNAASEHAAGTNLLLIAHHTSTHETRTVLTPRRALKANQLFTLTQAN